MQDKPVLKPIKHQTIDLPDTRILRLFYLPLDNNVPSSPPVPQFDLNRRVVFSGFDKLGNVFSTAQQLQGGGEYVSI